MSEGTFPNDILKNVSHSSFSLKEKAIELQTKRGDEEESNPALADDAFDDSSSSYCTALCSLSEYSEALEDETQTPCSELPCENASFESSHSEAVSGGTSTNSSPENVDLLQELKGKQEDDKGSSRDVLIKEPLYGQNKVSSSVKNPVLIESKQFPPSPKITILNVNLININSVDAEQDSAPKPYSSRKDFLLKPHDYFKSNKNGAQTGTKPFQSFSSMEPRFTSNTILTTSKGNKYNQERNQEHSGIKPEEHSTTLQQSSRNAHYKLSTECKLDSGESIISKMKWEGEDQGIEVEKEQAELSLKAGNRKPPASCTSTFTANKQKSEILPRCYSKRSLATRNQHQSQSPPVSRRLQKQSPQGVWLSKSLPPTPCSSSRQHCGTADTAAEEAFSMATTEMRGLATLDHARSSCPETSYLDVFNSTCWSSTQLSSDRDFHDWSKDVLSFTLPVISTNNHNTSACSEASSFECIDVALESHEEVTRNAKTVPKRQIQLKRRDNTESHASENNVILDFPSTSRPRDILQRQHSTPAAFHQDSHGTEPKSGQTERKQKLQKSLSLDETSSKTKMASCIIKSVLSKRMQHEQNLCSVDVPDQTFGPIKTDGTANNIDYLTSSAKEVCTETNKLNLAMVPLLSCSTSSQSPMLKTDSQTMRRSIKEHISVSSKIHPKLITKHSFNPLLGGVGRTQFQGNGTEITASPETEKEKLSPSKNAWLNNQGTGEKLSCDSAKSKAWISSAVISGAVGKQATVKTTPEECSTVQGAHKQHNVKDQPITSIEKQETPGEEKDNTQSLTMAACLVHNVDESTVDNVLPQSAQCNLEKDQENSKGELRPPGQSVSMGIQSQGKFRAIAPVHVVRDMRSLVKNTYSLSFRGPGEAAQGLEGTVPGFSPATPHPVNSKRVDKGKRHKQNEKRNVLKATPPLALDTVRDLASLNTTSRGCPTKANSILESHDKIPHTGFTKVSPISAAQTNSCGLSKSPEAQDSLTAISQANVQGNNTNMKQINRTGMPIQTHKETLTKISKNKQSADSRKPGCEKPRNFAMHLRQPLAAASLYCPPAESSDQQDSCKLSKQICSSEKDGHQTPGPPARSQSSAGPPSACILTVAPTPVFPSYFYKPSPLGYQTVSPNMGTVSYVQGPVLLQTPPHNQPATASCPVPLIRSLSVEGRLLSQPCTTDGYPVLQGSSKQTENGETSQKMPSPDTQQCTAFITTLGVEGIQGSASMLYPEVGGSLAQSPRHMLLDPETGHCFYVDMPQLPQRKMLFDPETCQYVEVIVPQQTLSSTVMTTPCAIPFPSLHIPAMYTPHCLSYVQAQPRVLPPPGP